jgi:hypothetical protein
LRKQLVLQAFVVVTPLEQSTKQHVFVASAGVCFGGIALVGKVIESEGVGSAATGVEAAAMRGNRRRCGVTTVEAIDDAGGGSSGVHRCLEKCGRVSAAQASSSSTSA